MTTLSCSTVGNQSCDGLKSFVIQQWFVRYVSLGLGPSNAGWKPSRQLSFTPTVNSSRAIILYLSCSVCLVGVSRAGVSEWARWPCWSAIRCLLGALWAVLLSDVCSSQASCWDGLKSYSLFVCPPRSCLGDVCTFISAGVGEDLSCLSLMSFFFFFAPWRWSRLSGYIIHCGTVVSPDHHIPLSASEVVLSSWSFLHCQGYVFSAPSHSVTNQKIPVKEYSWSSITMCQDWI